jgi:hypothetical protein
MGENAEPAQGVAAELKQMIKLQQSCVRHIP